MVFKWFTDPAAFRNFAQCAKESMMSEPFPTLPGPPPLRLMQMIAGIENAQLVYVVAKLGIADLLADGPKSADELARATGTHARSLRRVLRALAADKLFREDGDGRFGLTSETQALRTGVPGSIRASAVLNGEEWYWQTYGRLLDVVRTGKNAFEPVYGKTVYEYLSDNPSAGQAFSEFMEEASAPMDALIAESYDFGSIQKLVDVGGGRGSLLLTLLVDKPEMRGMLFDSPTVLQHVGPILREKGIADRCELVPGSFFESVPSGGDAYFLRNVLHDWDDQRALLLLGNCSKAMGPDARLLISEAILSDGPARGNVRYCDIQVMVSLGGCQRSEREVAALLDQVGLTLSAIVPTGPYLSIVEARPR